MAGVRAVSPASGAALRMIAATAGARVVVEIGTGLGVSGIHLLRGMRAGRGADHGGHRTGPAAAGPGGLPGGRLRGEPGALHPGPRADVLPRLADGGYDLVFCDGDRNEYVRYLAESLRLLRPGGLVCFEGVFAHGRAMDAAYQETEVREVREVMRAVRDSDELVPALLPTDDGLLCAVKRS